MLKPSYKLLAAAIVFPLLTILGQFLATSYPQAYKAVCLGGV